MDANELNPNGKLAAEKDLLARAVDPEFYAATNFGVGSADVLLNHFSSVGWRQGRDPNANFSVAWYLYAYPDVAASGMNPLVHYLRWGKSEKRTFRASMNRILLDRDRALARPCFDEDFYLSRRGSTLAYPDPLTDFMHMGWRLWLDPSPRFSVSRYFEEHPEVFMAGINPLMHSLGLGEVDRAAR
jgi:hypothetical protein